MERAIYDILIVEDFKDRSGTDRVQYHRAGVAFQNVRGGLNCEIVPGMALTNRFVIFPRSPERSPGDEEVDRATANHKNQP